MLLQIALIVGIHASIRVKQLRVVLADIHRLSIGSRGSSWPYDILPYTVHSIENPKKNGFADNPEVSITIFRYDRTHLSRSNTHKQDRTDKADSEGYKHRSQHSGTFHTRSRLFKTYRKRLRRIDKRHIVF